VAEVVTFGNHHLVADGLGAYIAKAATSGSFAQVMTGDVIVMSFYVVVVKSAGVAPASTTWPRPATHCERADLSKLWGHASVTSFEAPSLVPLSSARFAAVHSFKVE